MRNIIRKKSGFRSVKLKTAVFILSAAALLAGCSPLTASSGDSYVAEHLKTWSDGTSDYVFLPSGVSRHYAAEGKQGKILQSKLLPSVWITTDGGDHEAILNSKDEKLSGSMTIMDSSGELLAEYPIAYIKTRGNSSFVEYPKKQYQLKLTEKASLFGLPAGKKWVLTANASDSSLVRNALVRQLACDMDFPACDSGQFADLYINGEYQGNYYLCARIEISRTRLNIADLEEMTEKVNLTEDLSQYEDIWGEASRCKAIPEDPQDITGGYLFEREFQDRFELEAFDNSSYFRTEAGESMILESPESVSQKQLEYISGLVQQMENAILSEDGVDPESGRYYTELLDLHSFAAKYLLEEVSQNYDGGSSSSYFYKDRDRINPRICAGPPWDYDLTFGNLPSFIGSVEQTSETLTKLQVNTNGTSWFAALYEKQEFRDAVIRLYRDSVRELLRQYIEKGGELDRLAGETEYSAEMDSIRWKEMYDQAAAEKGYSYDRQQEIEEIRAFIERRLAFLDEEWKINGD